MEFPSLKAFGLIVLFLGFSSVLGYETESIAQAPHKGGHHHHHHHPPTQPPAHAPTTKLPVHPPVKTPVHPPVKSPAHPPVKTPAHPPVKAPAHPPVKSPAHPPVEAPAHPPIHAPAHPPAKAPAHPPTHTPIPLPPRKLVAVQGVVYCKACKYAGIDTLLGAAPLLDAVVRLQCNNTKKPLVVETKTDKKGYFVIKAPKTVTTYGSHKCRVFIVSSPSKTCNKPTNLNYGLKGAILMLSKKPPVEPKHPLAFDLFTVGPFAFDPDSKAPCPR